MKHTDARTLIINAFDNLNRDHYILRQSPSKHYRAIASNRSKYESCQKTFWAERASRQIKFFCRRPYCPTCANHHGKATGKQFATKFRAATKDDFVMATLVFIVTTSVDEIFAKFRRIRKALRKIVDNRRQSKTRIDRAGWREFGAAGALEIDAFEAQDFRRLGSAKQDQYRSLGFDPDIHWGPVFIGTAHALVHVGGLGLDAVTEILKSVSPVVHVRDLDEGQSLIQAAQETVGYASKTQYETRLAFGATQNWSLEIMQAYLLGAITNSRGRQGFRFSINPMRERKRKTEIRTEDNIIMPSLFMM